MLRLASLDYDEQVVALVKKPGITAVLKTMVYYSVSPLKALTITVWALNQENQFILNKNSYTFSGKLHLNFLMYFA